MFFHHSIWIVTATAAGVIALLHILIWLNRRKSYVYLIFSIAALAASVLAFMEDNMMHALNIEHMKFLLIYNHIPIAILVVSLSWFIYFHFGTAKKWMAISITALWIVSLIINFFSPSSLTYSEITAIEKIILDNGISYGIVTK